MYLLGKYVFKFEIFLLFRGEEHSVYYSNKKRHMCASFCLGTGLNKFFQKSAQMGISCFKCILEEFRKAIEQNSQRNQFLRYLKYISPIKLIANIASE